MEVNFRSDSLNRRSFFSIFFDRRTASNHQSPFDGDHVEYVSGPRRHGAANRPNMLQHLSRIEKSHQSDDGQGHSHPNAQRHL